METSVDLQLLGVSELNSIISSMDFGGRTNTEIKR